MLSSGVVASSFKQNQLDSKFLFYKETESLPLTFQ